VNNVLFLCCEEVSEQYIAAYKIQQTFAQAFGGGHVPVARLLYPPPVARGPKVTVGYNATGYIHA